MPDGSFVLRPPAPDDADIIAQLLTELGHATHSADIPQRFAAVEREGGTVFLASDPSGKIIGLVCLARHTVLHAPGPVAYITALVTTQAARRRGVGRALVAAARLWAQQHGCVRLSVTSAEHRADAHAFYPACGMPYTGRRFTTDITPTT